MRFCRFCSCGLSTMLANLASTPLKRKPQGSIPVMRPTLPSKWLPTAPAACAPRLYPITWTEDNGTPTCSSNRISEAVCSPTNLEFNTLMEHIYPAKDGYPPTLSLLNYQIITF